MSPRNAREPLTGHIQFFGPTGSGKTSRGMRPKIVDWIRSGTGGVLILDAMGDLPVEFRGMKDYLVIEPGVPLALIEGLSPTDIVQALDSVNPQQANGSSGTSEFWEGQARQMIFAGATFLKAVILAEKAKHNYADDDEDRQARWHMHGLHSLLSRAQRGTINDAQITTDLIALVRQYVPQPNAALFDSTQYLDQTLPSMDPRTRGDIWAQVQNKLRPFFSDSRLAPWACCEKGVDVDIVLRGGRVGLALPAAKFGSSGTHIQAMVKQRVWAGIRRRGSEWAAEGERPVLLAIDGADELVGSKTDWRMLPQGKSLGLCCAFSTQSVNCYISRIGDIGIVKKFIAEFRTTVAFGSADEGDQRPPLFKIPADLIEQPKEKAHEPA